MHERYYDPIAGRFLSVDPVTTDAKTGGHFNRYAYADNNPYKYTDPDGRSPVHAGLKALDLAVSAIEIMSAFHSGGAGAGIRATAEALLAPPGAKVAAKVMGAVGDAGKATAAAVKRETGSYTNLHASGKTYDGKGSRERSQESGRRVEKETGDQHTATDWSPAGSTREAFKQESQRLDSHGGPKSDTNHNKIESPGKKLREKDGG
jgi:uncharacterized protein RhaS with RHS repeats